MCHAHATPETVTYLAPEVLELTIAHDEWRRSRTRDERIWSNGPISVVLTIERKIEVQVGLLKPYTAQARQRAGYLEAKRAAIQLAQALEPKVKERNELLMHYRYPDEREEVEAQARLFLLDWTRISTSCTSGSTRWSGRWRPATSAASWRTSA